MQGLVSSGQPLCTKSLIAVLSSLMDLEVRAEENETLTLTCLAGARWPSVAVGCTGRPVDHCTHDEVQVIRRGTCLSFPPSLPFPARRFCNGNVNDTQRC